MPRCHSLHAACAASQAAASSCLHDATCFCIDLKCTSLQAWQLWCATSQPASHVLTHPPCCCGTAMRMCTPAGVPAVGVALAVSAAKGMACKLLPTCSHGITCFCNFMIMRPCRRGGCRCGAGGVCRQGHGLQAAAQLPTSRNPPLQNLQ